MFAELNDDGRRLGGFLITGLFSAAGAELLMTAKAFASVMVLFKSALALKTLTVAAGAGLGFFLFAKHGESADPTAATPGTPAAPKSPTAPGKGGIGGAISGALGALGFGSRG
jgi:hypothetical protein